MPLLSFQTSSVIRKAAWLPGMLSSTIHNTIYFRSKTNLYVPNLSFETKVATPYMTRFQKLHPQVHGKLNLLAGQHCGLTITDKTTHIFAAAN
jgi:hypothetical protein